MSVDLTDFDAKVAALDDSMTALAGSLGDVAPVVQAELADIHDKVHAALVVPPMTLTLAFGDGKTLAFSQDTTDDLGDYNGDFVHQKCLRQRAAGNGDYRDGFTVFFRPDADGNRAEIVVEYGTEFNFSVPPVAASGLTPAHLPAYTATIDGGDLTAPVTIPVPQHWWSARWRWQSAPRPIVRTMADLVAMKAILPLDATLARGGTPPKTAWQGPMQTGPVYYGMPDTGDRADIGFLPDWTAHYLLGDATYEPALRGGAEATGTMTFWARDAATGAPVDLLAHPYVAYNDSQGGFKGRIPAAGRPPGVTNWFILNEAHMPAAAFVPWLLTDDPYFLEGAQATAQYGILESNYRAVNEKLPALANTSQPRSFAWNLRDLMQLAAFAPETTPGWLLPRAYWKGLLPNSLTFAQKYPAANVSPCTTVFKLMTLTNLMMVFHEDFIAGVLAWAMWNGSFSEWQPILDYAMAPRMIMSDPTNAAGWDWRFQCPYEVPVVNARLGASVTIPTSTLYNVPANPETPADWKELWQCFNTAALAGAINDEKGFTDPATWGADNLNLLHQSYFPQTRWVLAILAMIGTPGAKDRHDWLKARMDRQLPTQVLASKWAVPPA